MKKNIIVARAQNNAIGKDNGLLWHISADLKHFKEETTGCPVIMGRKTYESIGKPLPNRHNIIITRGQINSQTAVSVQSLEEAYEEAEKYVNEKDTCYIIGGGTIYRQALERGDIDEINMTVVYKDFDADVYFPELDLDEWDIKEKTDKITDEKSGLDYRFVTLRHL